MDIRTSRHFKFPASIGLKATFKSLKIQKKNTTSRPQTPRHQVTSVLISSEHNVLADLLSAPYDLNKKCYASMILKPLQSGGLRIYVA